MAIFGTYNYALYTVYMQKEIFIFEKKNLTSNFTTTPFDEPKLTTESYLLSPYFLWASQKHLVFPWYDFC